MQTYLNRVQSQSPHILSRRATAEEIDQTTSPPIGYWYMNIQASARKLPHWLQQWLATTASHNQKSVWVTLLKKFWSLSGVTFRCL